jgi:hypothetical protein
VNFEYLACEVSKMKDNVDYDYLLLLLQALNFL